MLTTTNYKLNKPELTDTVGVSIPALSADMDVIDTQIKSMANTASANADGYVKDTATGIITQWGNVTIPANTGMSHVTFTIPFPVGVFTIMTSSASGGGNVRNTVTLSGFNIAMAGQVSWIAIGH